MEDANATGSGDEVTLSTGETLEYPVHTESAVSAVVLPANRKRAAELLPEGLSPVRAGRGTTAAWLVSARHRNVGNGALEDYDEFAVMIGATPGSAAGLPYVSLLRREAYVWYMPVTTESARAFGAELWGYPKVVADIDVEERGGGQRTTVSVDGEHFVTLDVERPPTFPWEDTLATYAVRNGRLLRVRTIVSGEMGAWPYTGQFSCTLGDHPRATELRRLDLGDRALARVYAEGTARFPPGDPVDEV